MALKGFIELLRLSQLAQKRRNQKQDQQPHWQGIAFSVADQHFVAPIGEVAEVLEVPDLITPIPLTKPWLLGIANVRGRLLPLIDLARFLNLRLERISSSHQSTASLDHYLSDSASPSQAVTGKLLVIDQQGFYCGLWIDEVWHIKQFLPEQYRPENIDSHSPFLPYTHGKFIAEDIKEWTIFMPSLLLQDPLFEDAALSL